MISGKVEYDRKDYNVAVMPHIDDINSDEDSSTSDEFLNNNDEERENGPDPNNLMDIGHVSPKGSIPLPGIDDDDSSDPPDLMAGDLGPTEGVDDEDQFLSDGPPSSSSNSSTSNENDNGTTSKTLMISEMKGSGLGSGVASSRGIGSLRSLHSGHGNNLNVNLINLNLKNIAMPIVDPIISPAQSVLSESESIEFNDGQTHHTKTAKTTPNVSMKNIEKYKPQNSLLSEEEKEERKNNDNNQGSISGFNYIEHNYRASKVTDYSAVYGHGRNDTNYQRVCKSCI